MPSSTTACGTASSTANPCTGEASGFKFATSNAATCQVPTGYKLDALGQLVGTTNPQTGQVIPTLNYAQRPVSGFRLQDGRASYGLGLETFALGFPIHFMATPTATLHSDTPTLIPGL